MATGNSSKPIIFAIFANTFIGISKFMGFFFSGSSALLSEGIHSIADTMNQFLLYVGIKRSQKSETEKYHFGFSQERFFWNLLSAVGIFVLGCGVTVYHGMADLFSEKTAVSGGKEQVVILIILFISMIIESFSFKIAVAEIKAQAKIRGKKFFSYLKESMDPSVSAVFWEDLAAILGILLAFTGIGLMAITGNKAFDSFASIAIGLLMGWIAWHLAIENKRFLIDKAIPEYEVNLLLGVLKKNPAIKEYANIKTVVLGPDRLKFSANLQLNLDVILLNARKNYIEKINEKNQLNGTECDITKILCEYDDLVYQEIQEEIRKIEEELRAALPNLKHIALKV